MKRFFLSAKKIWSTFLLAIAFCSTASAQDKNAKPVASAVYQSMKKVADWQINDIERRGWRYPKTDWTNGAYYTGMMAFSRIANDEKYLQFLKKIGEELQWKGGPERFFADDYCVGQTWAELFQLYQDSAMIRPMMSLGNDIISRPHTESLVWNWEGKLHNREWAWCDALYMGPPMLAYLSTASGQGKYLDIANKLWWRTTEFLYDSTEFLFYRDSRYFDQREKNGAKVFWSRGNGWVIAGITRMLQNMNKSYPDYARYVSLFKDMSKKIAGLQQPDGTWHASLLDPGSYPIQESSGTAFFCYAFFWGLNQGLLDEQTFLPVALKAWDALVKSIHSNGKLGYVQVPGASPDKVSFDDSEVYGVGAFLLAGTELFQWINRSSSSLLVVKNPSGANRVETVVEVNWATLAAKGFQPDQLTLVDLRNDQEIPHQIIRNASGKPELLLLQAGTAPGGTAQYRLEKRKPAAAASKTFGRQVPERLDDFAWENDKVIFRMYGPALEKTGEISSGIDIWAKNTPRLVINEWYKKDDYHKDYGEGLDFYKVGRSLGGGAPAPFWEGNIVPSKNYIAFKVLENGPLRTKFELTYAPWKVGNQMVSEVKTITLDAGSWWNKVEVRYQFNSPTLEVAAGFVTLGTGQTWSALQSQSASISYLQPDSKDGAVGAGLILPQAGKIKSVVFEKNEHILLVGKVNKGETFTYYTGGYWTKSGAFPTFADWNDLLLQHQKAMEKPLQVAIK